MSRKFKGESSPIREHTSSSQMENGKFYDLNPPAQTSKGTVRRVRCEERCRPLAQYQDTYLVSGIPDGGNEEHRFALEFRGGVTVNPAPEQEFLVVVNTYNPKKSKKTLN